MLLDMHFLDTDKFFIKHGFVSYKWHLLTKTHPSEFYRYSENLKLKKLIEIL